MLTYTRQYIEEGRKSLADLIRVLVAREDPIIFERLDVDDDAIFLEPFLFTYFNANDAIGFSLSQILFGYLQPVKRPAQIEVISTDEGIVYLPTIGYLKTDFASKRLLLEYDFHSDSFLLKNENETIDFQIEKPIKIAGTDIELLHHYLPALSVCFEADCSAHFEELATEYQNILTQAFELLKVNYSEFYHLCCIYIRKIVLFHSAQHNSFATLKAHGIIFINIVEKSSPAFFVEDILHQAGHVIFSTLTAEKKAYLTIEPETMLCDITGVKEEHRSIYTAFHGLFTEALMHEGIDRCLDDVSIDDEIRLEFGARLGFIFMKFCLDIRDMDRQEYYTPRGWAILCAIKDKLTAIYIKHKALLNSYRYHNQPYTFSYERFLELNNPKHVTV